MPKPAADPLNPTIEQIGKLLTIGEKHQLGGNGAPVGVVLIYENQAFLNGSWGGNQEDRMAALAEAAASEGLKTK